MSTQLQRILSELRQSSFPRLSGTLSRRNIARTPLRRRGAPQIDAKALSTTRHLQHGSPSPSSSVDASEVSHFNALASSWWDLHGPSRLLHLMNPLRHEFISRCQSTTTTTSHPPPTATAPAPKSQGLHYLDIGCGGGIFAESAARLPTTSSVTAIDASPQVLTVAREHARRDPLLMRPGRLTYLDTPIEGLSSLLSSTPHPTPAGRTSTPSNPTAAAGATAQQQQRTFDITTLFEILEHIPHPSPFLSTVATFVPVGGLLVGSTIARTWTSWFTTKLVAEEIVGVVPRGTHDWNRYINPDELRGWFEGKQKGGGEGEGRWGEWRVMEVAYVPGLGWREVRGVQGLGNYFFGVRRLA